MMHDLVLITLNWLFKNLGRYTRPPPPLPVLARLAEMLSRGWSAWALGFARHAGHRWPAAVWAAVALVALRRQWLWWLSGAVASGLVGPVGFLASISFASLGFLGVAFSREEWGCRRKPCPFMGR